MTNMKTLKQIIKEVQQYQCTEGSQADCELRTFALRVNLLRDIYDVCDAYMKRFDDYNLLSQFTDDFFLIVNQIEPSINAVQKRIKAGLDKNTLFECMRTIQLAFKREELLEKYEGKDKEFVEQIIRETEEYFDVTYGKK